MFLNTGDLKNDTCSSCAYRPYLVNLLPCLTRTSKRPEESVQETLAAAVPKIMASFGNFANDNEIKVWLLPLGMSLVDLWGESLLRLLLESCWLYSEASQELCFTSAFLSRGNLSREIVFRGKFKGISPEWMGFGILNWSFWPAEETRLHRKERRTDWPCGGGRPKTTGLFFGL